MPFRTERLWLQSNIWIRKDIRKFENYEGKYSCAGNLQRVALISHIFTAFSRSSSSTNCVSLIAGTRSSNYSLIYAFPLSTAPGHKWERERVKEKQKRSSLLIKSRPSFLLSTILHLVANARIMRLREVDFGAKPEYTSFDDRVTTFRFVSRVKRPLFAE